MATYVANWLNNEVKLSVTINSPSLQFSNGYLFGEVLLALKYMSSADHSSFVNGNSTLTRLQNFSLVTSCLASNQVQYDKGLIPLILTEARGAAADLLLRIKEHNEARSRPPAKEKLLSTHSVRPRPFVRAPLTDWGLDDFYGRTISQIGTADFNKLDEAIHLRRFHDEQRRAEREEEQRESDNAAGKAASTKQRIADQIQKARDRDKFTDDWIEAGRRSWSLNDQVRREREVQLLRFELSVVAAARRRAENDATLHGRDLEVGVADFERIMKRLGVGGDAGGGAEELKGGGASELTNESGLGYLSRIEATVAELRLAPEGNFEMMEALRQKEKANKRARAERETRRRKQLGDQRLAGLDLEAAMSAESLLAGLVAESGKQRERALRDWEMRKGAERRAAEKAEAIAARAAAREAEEANMLRKSLEEARVRLQGPEAREDRDKAWAEVEDTRERRRARKGADAVAVVGSAVSKLLDLVDVLCGERERRAAEDGVVGVEPAFLREAKGRFVGPRGFYKEPETKIPDVFTAEEVAHGFAEGVAWLNGTGPWAPPPALSAGSLSQAPASSPPFALTRGDSSAFEETTSRTTEAEESPTPTSDPVDSPDPATVTPPLTATATITTTAPMKVTRSRIYDSPDYADDVKSALSKLCKDYVSTKDYAAWTLYEYARYLRREDERTPSICAKYQKKLLSMPTKDNSDFDAIEFVIANFETELGDICEERCDASRDVCDGSGSRGRQWIENVCAERGAAFSNLCGVVSDNAAYRVDSLLKCLELEKIEAAEAVEKAAAQKAAEEEAERLRLEEEAAEKARLKAEEEAMLAELAKKGKKPPKPAATEEPPSVVDEAAEEAKRIATEEAELARLESEAAAAAAVEASRTRLQELGRQKLAVAKVAFFAFASEAQDKWFQDSVAKATRTLDSIETLISNILAAGNQQEAVYDCACIAVEMMELIVRTYPRFVEFQQQALGVADILISQLDRMSSARAKVESTAIANLCKNIGAAAVADWASFPNFNVSFPTMGGLVTAIDAPFPGTVFDSRGNSVSSSFLRAAAKRLKETSKGGSTVGIESFAAVIARVVEKDCAYDDDVGALESVVGGALGRGGTLAWARDREVVLSMARKMDTGKTGRVPWKKLLHNLICCHLPRLCTADELRSMKAAAKAVSLGGWRKDGSLSIPVKEFLRLNFWFDDGDRAIDPRLSGQLKEVYSIIFSDDRDDTLVNFSELAFVWCCWKKEESTSSANPQVGLLRALVVAEGVAEGAALAPGGREGKFGPVCTASQLDWLLSSDSGAAALSTSIFAEARSLELSRGEGGDAGREERLEDAGDQKVVVSFSTLCECKSVKDAGVTLFALEDLFAF